ncbi:FAD-binding oxidoreductase [Synoicihabitans lomoniglobus]|uniref:FAD-linked oxidase C-terminal domain-containing protein n=1 Tax=Synoicihabitans lomoniglobus TaxID=2909285 RepID=A0AAE9ZW93_9BACT|nr:FAD-binding protein [Opitutaceae bacterium LMO-M01]WED63668.1 FAD-linked oxidase C-terminal domain-containing protein [Opitutaceae bacterium LMO-M01]
MTAPDVRHALGSTLADADILTEIEDLIPYGFDGTATLKERPLAVVFPRSTKQVSAVVKWAREARVPVVSRGNGTGLSGGSVPVAGGLVLCLNHLDRIVELDRANLTIRAQAGVVTQDIFAAADAAGLFYPPDPGSMKISTIGGNVAENSGGLRGLKYGVTRDYVLGMEVVLADGSICRLGTACVKDVAGYSLRDLFIGSEGTLGIVTEVLLKLLPRPTARRTLLATFAAMDEAAATVSAIIAAGIVPCTLEFLDRRTIQCVEDFAHVGLPTDAEAVLLIEADGHPAAVDDEVAHIEKLCREHAATTVRVAADAAEATRLATARRSAFSALARLRPTTILEDVTVPRSELAAMIRDVEAIALKHDVQIATFGHFGDGNLHPTILTDERDTAEMHRVEAAITAIVEAALARGGTITGEHGVGLAKKPFLRRQLGDASYSLLQLVKRSFDPDGLLNPGKIFDLPA